MAGLSTADITKILRDPQSVSAMDPAKIAALKDTYPYFITAHYLDALVKQKQEPFSAPMLETLQLYKGNWLLLHQFLNSATLPEKMPEPVAAEPEPIVASTVAEPVAADIEPKEEILKEIIAEESMMQEKPAQPKQEEPLIQPIYTEDYFLHQGLDVSNDLQEGEALKPSAPVQEDEEDKSLMVVMSFSEWLAFFKIKSQKEKEEEADQKALRTMWQKEKLAAAMEEENDIIPENVFEMAVNSITNEDDLASDSLAEIYVKQGKYDKAIDMYRKLSLRNPQKNAYFARKIETILKEKQS